MTKKLPALIIAALMLLALLPAAALAAEPDALTWEELQQAIKDTPGTASEPAEEPTLITLTNSLTATDSDEALRILAGKNIILDLNGFSIDRGLSKKSAVEFGEVIIVNGELTVKDGSNPSTGKITGGNSSNFCGGGVNIDGGKFTLVSGSITGNQSVHAGGGVLVLTDGIFILDGGRIAGNRTGDGGGGVFCHGSFVMKSGEISGNTSVKHGGGVYVHGDYSEDPVPTAKAFAMYGGRIANNHVSDGDGGGVFADNYNMVLQLFGGEISGNTASGAGGGVCANMSITVGGETVVKKNTANARTDNVFLYNETKADYNPLIIVSTDVPLTGNAEIGVTLESAAGAFIGSCDEKFSEFFFADNGGVIVYEAGRLEIAELCEYERKAGEPVSYGQYILKLNGRDCGEYAFSEEPDGTWRIRKVPQLGTPQFLTVEDGRLAFVSGGDVSWTFGENGIYTSVRTAVQTPGFWFLFWHIPASTRIVTTDYYLVSTVEGAALSTRPARVELYERVTGTHQYGEPVNNYNGTHTFVCDHCGSEKTVDCAYTLDDETYCECGAYNPAKCDLHVDYTQTPTTVYGWFWIPYRVYTTTITVTGSDAGGVEKIEYSLDGGKTWRRGTTIVSNTEIGSFLVRVTDTHGTWIFTPGKKKK